MMNIAVNGAVLTVKMCENSSAEAVKELIRKGPVTIDMKDYAHMEKFGKLGTKFPRNDKHITTEAGDVILSEGNLLVIYYAPNTWNFTKIGKVQDLSAEELKKVLGKGNVTVTLTWTDDPTSKKYLEV